MEPGRTGFPPSRALRRGIELSDTPPGLAPDERGGDAGPSEARLTLIRSSRQSPLASPSSLGSPASNRLTSNLNLILQARQSGGIGDGAGPRYCGIRMNS